MLDHVRTHQTMVPPVELRPDTLPTERLLANGKAVPEVRAELRRIPNVRNAGNVVSVWAQSFGLIALACWIGHPVMWVATFVLMGRAFALYGILGHEAAHRLLFSRRWLNDGIGRWGLSYPGFVPFDVYRRSHFAHHKDEMGPEEPDIPLYAHYPITRDSLGRKLWRDARGSTGWKQLKGLFRGLQHERTRPVALRILGTQLVILGIFTAFGRPELYPLLWLLPWMTGWRVINRLRAIAEHGGMIRSDDRRETTHHVEQHGAARFWIVPFNTGWHLAHHVDMGVPFRHLPAFHQELVDAGWVVPDLVYPNYVTLWKALSGRRPPG
jgi:fatty acid desaturase